MCCKKRHVRRPASAAVANRTIRATHNINPARHDVIRFLGGKGTINEKNWNVEAARGVYSSCNVLISCFQCEQTQRSVLQGSAVLDLLVQDHVRAHLFHMQS